MSNPLNIEVDHVTAQTQDFTNSLDHFIATAKSFAQGVEATSAFWQGPARSAAYSTGLDLHASLTDLHQWGMRLVESVGQNVNAMHNNEVDQAQNFTALGGGTTDTPVST